MTTLKNGFAVIKLVGWDDTVLSMHRTLAAAEKALRARGGQHALRVAEVREGGGVEVVTLFDKPVLRPCAPRVVRVP